MGEDELATLSKEFPTMPVVIKWAMSPRSLHTAVDAIKAIDDAGHACGDYPREVFLSCETMDNLNKIKLALQ